MKTAKWTLILTVLTLAACVYEAPLTTQHTLPIDQAVLGTWQTVSGDGSVEHLRILRFSDTEYLVNHAESDDQLFFRAYTIEVGGVSAVQLEFLGDDTRPVRGKNRYLVATYRIVDEMLEVRTLNSDLVGEELSDSESLRAAFTAHKENPELFNDPGLFKRIES